MSDVGNYIGWVPGSPDPTLDRGGPDANPAGKCASCGGSAPKTAKRCHPCADAWQADSQSIDDAAKALFKAQDLGAAKALAQRVKDGINAGHSGPWISAARHLVAALLDGIPSPLRVPFGPSVQLRPRDQDTDNACLRRWGVK